MIHSFVHAFWEGLLWPAAVPGAREAKVVRRIFPHHPPGACYTKLRDNCRNCYQGEVQSVPREYTEGLTVWRMWAGRKAEKVP